MPTYLYRCPACGKEFEAYGRLDDRYIACFCGETAERRPFSGIPHIKGETVAKAIPDPQYRHEAEKRAFNQTWGDATRSMELLRANRVEDSQGRVSIDTAKVTRES